ncbi:amine oxidase, partial [Gongronella butleri]
EIGIIGAGASGLFSGYLLDSVGFHNYDILEANDRLGGRIHTHYFGSPDDYQYQEMGPMRFPIAYTHNNKTMPVNDHDIVFQLADELNKKNSKKHEIKFIKWIQQDENALVYQNGIRLPNGQVPTYGDIAKNKSLTLDVGSLSEESDEVSSKFLSDDWMNAIREDIYAAHQKALDEGLDDWSLYGYMHNKFHKSLNASDYATGGEPGQIWGTMYDQMTFMSTDWRTVDRGLNRIAEAFAPVLGKKVKFHTKVTKLEVEDDKVKVLWKTKPYDIKYKSKTYDRVIVGVPFSVVRTWHLPQMSYTISQAIRNLGYSQACKVAMQFKTRFWEHLDRPILGGCSSTDLAAGSVCYPSYKIGASGPGVMLASYNSGDMGLRLASMTEDEHVALILENMVELYGDIARDQYTGNYNRRCWQNDALQSGSWAEPSAGQHKLFMPSYFKMEQGLVFVGEHTDVKHAWISAALESAIRGVTMVLVEAGHIDEAKKIVKHWNANWLKI